MEKFCERLKELRLSKKLSVRQFAKMIGVRDTTVLRWESNTIEPSISKIITISKLFDISADYLLGLED